VAVNARERVLQAIDPVWTERFLADLVRIESINPETWPGGSGEAAVAARVAEELRACGLAPQLREAAPGRPNVLAELAGEGGRTLLLEAHLDTVQAEGMAEPFAARVADGMLYGRGACDDKASVAAFVGALRALRLAGVKPPVRVLLAAVAGEEYAGRGIRALLAGGLRADAAIVGEPTRLDVVVAHKGCVRAELVVRGRAAHSSRPEDGRNAIEAMADIIAGLHARLDAPYAARAHPLAGAPTLAFTQIAGGVGINTIPERCVARFDRRVAPGETAAAALAELRAALAALPLPDGVAAEVGEPFIAEEALATPTEEPLVRALLAAARRHHPPARLAGVPYGTDANRIAPYGIPCVVFGPGDIALAHAAHEAVPLAEVVAATRIVAEVILGGLSVARPATAAREASPSSTDALGC
jgi:succinyl-diaminopimelate desuccinylase